MSVSILDYGMGNLGSVVNMFKKLGVATQLVNHPDEIDTAERLLLPGVGSFDHAMSLLESQEFIEPIHRFAESGKAMLGICLGMQLLLNTSEEGQLAGLGLIRGGCHKFAATAEAPDLKIPHLGWNRVTPTQNNPIFAQLTEENRFYFAHSYYVVPEENNQVLATSHYGLEFASMINADNIYGAQYHPEKSHRFGMQILKAFASL